MSEDPLLPIIDVLGHWRRPLRTDLCGEAFRSVSRVACVFKPAAIKELNDHCSTRTDVELGGLLVGEVFCYRDSYLVRITDALPARQSVCSRYSITFTAADWIDLAKRREALPGRMTVGWYHTHPGMGVFLSSNDQFLHKSYFGDQPWYLALVIDPLASEQGVFCMRDGEFVRDPDLVMYSASFGEE